MADDVQMSQNGQIYTPRFYPGADPDNPNKNAPPGSSQRLQTSMPYYVQFSTPFKTNIAINENTRSSDSSKRLSELAKRGGNFEMEIGQAAVVPIATKRIMTPNGKEVLIDVGEIVPDSYLSDERFKGAFKYEAFAFGTASWDKDGEKSSEPVYLLLKDVASAGLDVKSDKEKTPFVKGAKMLYAERDKLNAQLGVTSTTTAPKTTTTTAAPAQKKATKPRPY
jgi:hypothetical protein